MWAQPRAWVRRSAGSLRGNGHGGFNRARDRDSSLPCDPFPQWPQGKGAGRRVRNLAQHIDLVPTVLDYVGGPRRSGLLGRSLWRLVDNKPGGPYGREPAVLSYLLLDGREVESVVVGNDKLIRYLDYDRPIVPYQLFESERTITARSRKISR